MIEGNDRPDPYRMWTQVVSGEIRHLTALMNTLTEQGERQQENWQRDHDLLIRVNERMAAIDDRLRVIEQVRRESRITDVVLAVAAAVAGALGIRYGD